MSNNDLVEISELDVGTLARNIKNQIDINPKWMSQFHNYLSNQLIDYFNKNKGINPKDFIDTISNIDENTISDIILKNDIPPEILNAVNEVLPPNKENASPAYKNSIFVLIIYAFIQRIIYDEKNKGKFVGTQKLTDYLNNNAREGGKKTRNYRKRKTNKNKKRKTNKNKKRKSKKRARQIY